MSEGELITNEEVDHGQATMIFVLGLLGVLMCQILAPVAFFLGNKYRKECAEAGVEPEGLATAGWILGLIGSVLLLLTAIFLILYFGFFCVMMVVYFVMILMVGAGAAI